ncbi:endonuclease/exonuclease/phosphatase family protein [Nonomuraea sp. NPDC005650]|uniref:endonuclease/exonuclease/phosphatase family protein n=1 Tax=Nonomuraea sp. NPDC005650 TaxID=3157045 RepID=UPI0033B3FDFA
MRSDHSFTMASCNVHGGYDRNGKPFDLIQMCRSLKADVIALQETWTPDGGDDPIAAAAASLGVEAAGHDLMHTTLHDLGISGAEPHQGGRWGLSLLTSWPMESKEIIVLGRAPRDAAVRVAQVIVVSLPTGRPLRIVNTHLTYRVPFSVPQLLRLARRLKPSSIPTLIVGDLNMFWPSTMVAVGYRRALRGATWPAHRPAVQLDHMLIDRNISSLRGEVLNIAGSDHLPIRAELSC